MSGTVTETDSERRQLTEPQMRKRRQPHEGWLLKQQCKQSMVGLQSSFKG